MNSTLWFDFVLETTHTLKDKAASLLGQCDTTLKRRGGSHNDKWSKQIISSSIWLYGITAALFKFTIGAKIWLEFHLSLSWERHVKIKYKMNAIEFHLQVCHKKNNWHVKPFSNSSVYSIPYNIFLPKSHGYWLPRTLVHDTFPSTRYTFFWREVPFSKYRQHQPMRILMSPILRSFSFLHNAVYSWNDI